MTRTRASYAFAALVLVIAAGPAFAADDSNKPPHVADPFADPKNDPYNPLRYIASNALTTIAVLLIGATALSHVFCMWKWRAWWMSCLIVGEFAFAYGIGCRYVLHNNPDSKTWYIMEYLFVILSPCTFVAADYIILGRLVQFLGCQKHLRLVPPRRIALLFLCSDIVTFLIQTTGGVVLMGDSSMHALTNSSYGQIFLWGLIIQLLSFFLFFAIFAIFVYRIRKYEIRVWEKDSREKWYNDWRALAGALALNCVGIIIRSLYRTVEMSQGFHSTLSTTEAYFYALDTLPLFLAIVVYVPFWPGRFITSNAMPAGKILDEEQSDYVGLAGRKGDLETMRMNNAGFSDSSVTLHVLETRP
ncbi:hypothetical protein EVG20_g3480 [Dentipellis fragilis]|uniref:RTA1-domain-containing protein n=1 Tax=Dentipellis fragilis TaxID=205917 RepID=A0A4Y9Z1C5_9AGAM|nr:hypothetical protein EVG20_g3480 [Dentipellis fragilis]